ncbi:MAG: hypothetical protein K2O67_06380 [Clostridia bacterium]|nr:hypothetical protein [Clostridia bacterium]
MKKVKNFFKNFWSFYRLTGVGTNVRGAGRKISPFAVTMFATFLSCFTAFMHLGSSYMFGLGLVACMLAISIGQATYDKTALISVAPFSPKQRVAFSFLTMLLNMLIFITAINAITWIVFLTIALIVFCITRGNIFITEFAEIMQPTPISPYGAGTLVLVFFIIFFAALALSHIDKSKTRTICSVAFFGVSEVIALSIANACGFAAQQGQGVIQNFFLEVDLVNTIDKLNHPWIVIAVLAVIVAALFAVALWLIIKRHKSTDL